MNYKQNVADFLNSLLNKKCWKPANLAREMSISQGRLTQYLKAEELPRAEGLIKIAELGNVTIDELLRGKKRKQPSTPPLPPEAEKVIAILEKGTPEDIGYLRGVIDSEYRKLKRPRKG